MRTLGWLLLFVAIQGVWATPVRAQSSLGLQMELGAYQVRATGHGSPYGDEVDSRTRILPGIRASVGVDRRLSLTAGVAASFVQFGNFLVVDAGIEGRLQRSNGPFARFAIAMMKSTGFLDCVTGINCPDWGNRKRFGLNAALGYAIGLGHRRAIGPTLQVGYSFAGGVTYRYFSAGARLRVF